MELRVKPEVDFLPESRIESIADALLRRLEEHLKEPLVPPVNVEFLAEDVLGFSLQSEELAEADALAYIDPNEKVICTNLARSDYFDEIGPEFTWAHEIGHSELGHFVEVGKQLTLGFLGEPKKLIHRDSICEGDKYYRHERQANFFAACLMMPRRLIVPEAQQVDCRQWSEIARLAKRFNVSASAMRIRLEELNLVYFDGKTLYGSKQEAKGQLPLL